jgi:hypothetical protein
MNIPIGLPRGPNQGLRLKKDKSNSKNSSKNDSNLENTKI